MKEALKLALEALEDIKDDCSGCEFEWSNDYPLQAKALAAIDEALAQPVSSHGNAEDLYVEMSKHLNCPHCGGSGHIDDVAQPEQEPVAMKFKIYKPTVPDPMRQDINNALLPWVYDQDRSSGFDASMWVTPVATLPPQRKPLTDEQKLNLVTNWFAEDWAIKKALGLLRDYDYEATHGIKGDA